MKTWTRVMVDIEVGGEDAVNAAELVADAVLEKLAEKSMWHVKHSEVLVVPDIEQPIGGG